MKEKLYKKEITLTIVFSVLLLLMGHSAAIFVLFPVLQQGTLWGFPIQYILPILLGWFGIAGVCIVMAIVCNKFDDEMEAYVNSLPLKLKPTLKRLIDKEALCLQNMH